MKKVTKVDKLYVDARYPANLGLLPDGMPSLKQARKFEAFARSIHRNIESVLMSKSQSE